MSIVSIVQSLLKNNFASAVIKLPLLTDTIDTILDSLPNMDYLPSRVTALHRFCERVFVGEKKLCFHFSM